MIEQNNHRRSAILAPYNPYVGEPLGQSPTGVIERFRLTLQEKTAIHVARLTEPVETDHFWLPSTMRVGVERLLEQGVLDLGALHELRLDHDFEYWAACEVEVKNRKGQVVPFILNPSQRIYLGHVERQRQARRPIRIVVLKHRRWGATTFSYSYVAWHQLQLYTGRDAWFVGLDGDGANDVIERYKSILKRKHGHGPRALRAVFRPYGNSVNSRQLVGRDATLSAGSVNAPNAPSGRDAHFAHLFEVGKWPSNPVVSAERVAQNLGAMLPNEPGTIAIMESTAQGLVGTYFKTVCQMAEAGKFDTGGSSAYAFAFIGALTDPACMLDPAELGFRGNDGIERFVESWDDDDKETWAWGGTIEHVAWYRQKKASPEYKDLWRLREEYPRNSKEAFQGAGRPVFRPVYVEAMRKTCRSPAKQGYLRGATMVGAKSLTSLSFKADASGPLQIWRDPGYDYGFGRDAKGRLYNPERYLYKYRYAIAADIGGMHKDSDYNEIGVLDRLPVLFNGRPEIVAVWRAHIEVIRFAWAAMQIGKWYGSANGEHDAFFIMEANSLRKRHKEQADANNFLAFLHQIRDSYDELYYREEYDSDAEKPVQKIGFWTGGENRNLLIADLQMAALGIYQGPSSDAYREHAYIERDAEACNQYDTFVVKEDGRMEHEEKKKDDKVIVRGLLQYAHGVMPLPTPIERESRASRVIVGASQF